MEKRIRVYKESESVVFMKTNEAFGGLSNMAPLYPIIINGIEVATSEGLYQSFRFTHISKVQRLIIREKNPMIAKQISRNYNNYTRSDWNLIRVNVMRWCLRAKLICNFNKFRSLLLSTEEKSIVEKSYKDKFWGAMPNKNGELIGENVLGRLLMELREECRTMGENTDKKFLKPLSVENFLFLDKKIEPLVVIKKKEEPLQINMLRENLD
ncbi:NADAR family protein [Clostridium perfringens]|uniref:NADAR family protein n=1 Tax=Clostridium perfringens TaxID=1502 RepID=UPI00285DA723|nr:NADAR family protein [Clostridium perfringens]ELC8347073.1 NADAR family protein [Clostridium perfringens]MBS5968133.1 NADAR family protein [Clostridium perfringens]